MRIDSEYYNDWLFKAENDLLAANGILYYYEDPPTDTICYHSHQVAEKSLKAFLLQVEVEIPRTHDLVELLNFAIFRNENFVELKDKIETLNKYYIETKYPISPSIVYSKEESKLAVEYATKILSFVKSKI